MLNRYRLALMEEADAPATPAATPASSAPAAPPAPAAPVPGEEFKGMSAEQFKARIAEAQQSGQRQLLKDLGLKDASELKARLDEFKKLQDAQLTEQERLKKQLEELTPKAAEAVRLHQIVADRAKVEFERLPKAAQDYIAKIAGEDPAARLNAINAAAETGLLSALQPSAPVAPASAPTATPPPANPATTIAPPGPATPPPTGTKSELQQYEDLKSRGMTRLAAQFYEQYGALIEQQRAASKKTT